VTQLFTEPYMVEYLLHNTIGAVWRANHPELAERLPLRYLVTPDAGESEQPSTSKIGRFGSLKLIGPVLRVGAFPRRCAASVGAHAGGNRGPECS